MYVDDPYGILPAHEFSHYLSYPLTKAPIDIPADHPQYKYFTQGNNAELMARFSQLKNYFGLKDDLPITEEMWKYA
jgi:hypothetical protein